MKKIIICLLTICVGFPGMTIAECKVKFQWSPQEFNEEVVGYMIFCREEGKNYDYNDPAWQGDNTFFQCTIDGLDESKTYYFVIRSVDQNDNQSADSPEVEFNYTSHNAGLGGNGSSGISTSTSFSSCFLQTLSDPGLK